MHPVRHALGALLLEQNEIEEAEEVYRADLKLHPNNCWSLQGLSECLERKNSRSKEIQYLFEKTQERAEIPLKTSCFCRLSAV